MLDAANVLMQNYQIVAPRSVPISTPAATSTSATSTTSKPDDVANPTTSKVTTTESKTDELPSTSSAAAAVAAAAATLAAASQKEMPIKAEESKEIPVAKHNQVTIEDLGGEEDDHIDGPEKATIASTSKEVDSTAEQINELRKRRLKFLEERNKTSTE